LKVLRKTYIHELVKLCEEIKRFFKEKNGFLMASIIILNAQGFGESTITF